MSNIGIFGVIYDRLFTAFATTTVTEQKITEPKKNTFVMDYDSRGYPSLKSIEPKKNVVVVGYGWGGRSFCNKIDTKKYNVIVLSKNDYMLNTTKLKNSIESTDEKLMLFNTKNNISFIKEECIDINQKENIVSTDNKKIKFDYLVVAVGSDVNDFGVPGVKDKCYFLKTMDDLQSLKKSLETKEFKNGKPYYPNSDIDVVILGGGPTGIELAFEMSKKYKNIKIIEAMPTILPMFSKETTSMIIDELNKHNIQLILNEKVKKIIDDGIHSSNDKGDKSYHHDIAIWTCGIKPNPLIKKLLNPDMNNKFVVDKNLKFSNNIYAIGDIVASKELGPPTGQNAKNQGKYLANYFNNDFKGEDYEYKEIGKMLHTRDNIIFENKFGTIRLPKLFQPIIDYYIEN
jgi:NADH:ubiquinone reductase (non-electrogenic)